jgi:hypothetical protein
MTVKQKLYQSYSNFYSGSAAKNESVRFVHNCSIKSLYCDYHSPSRRLFPLELIQFCFIVAYSEWIFFLFDAKCGVRSKTSWCHCGIFPWKGNLWEIFMENENHIKLKRYFNEDFEASPRSCCSFSTFFFATSHLTNFKALVGNKNLAQLLFRAI